MTNILLTDTDFDFVPSSVRAISLHYSLKTLHLQFRKLHFHSFNDYTNILEGIVLFPCLGEIRFLGDN